MLTISPARRIRSDRWLSLVMLFTLHAALWVGVQSVWARPLLFAHLGLFLLWQPLWRGEDRLSTRSALTIVGISTLALFWLNGWIVAFWVSGLFSLVGSRVFAFQSAAQRLRYLLAMAYLLAVLLMWVTPQLFALPVTTEASTELMQIVLPLLLLLMALVPHESERLKKIEAVDLVYSLLLFMLLTLLVLGSLAFMSLGQVEYFQALLRTLFLMAAVLFVLGWLWNPRLGFAGFQIIFSRYFLNIGTPFELWLNKLSQLALKENSPASFLEIATAHLAALPWLSGVRWQCDVAKGQQGAASVHEFSWADQDLKLVLYARQNVPPTVLMHIHLLCQMLAFFYHAKRREQRLQEMARLQAVHETGARLTHDLKNMLQSLMVLISIAEKQPAKAQSILLHQMPVLVKQIELVLSKLKIPGQDTKMNLMPLAAWWKKLQQREQYRNLQWQSEGGLGNQEIPAALFDSIADNLIENVHGKSLREQDITVQVFLKAQPLCFSVCDNGSAIPEEMANRLFHTVVDSEDGWGIGLYQVARWARQLGYHLILKENYKGKVCFELVRHIENN